jgi:hypothetical protein
MYYSSTLPLIWVSVSVKRVKSFRVLLVSVYFARHHQDLVIYYFCKI